MHFFKNDLASRKDNVRVINIHGCRTEADVSDLKLILKTSSNDEIGQFRRIRECQSDERIDTSSTLTDDSIEVSDCWERLGTTTTKY